MVIDEKMTKQSLWVNQYLGRASPQTCLNGSMIRKAGHMFQHLLVLGAPQQVISKSFSYCNLELDAEPAKVVTGLAAFRTHSMECCRGYVIQQFTTVF
jgi:hypothetical protein